MITSKQAARIRWELKSGKKKVSEARRAQLAEYDAAQGGDPNVQQSPGESRGEGGGDNPPKVDPSREPPPPADPIPDPIPNVEPPPHVPHAASSSSSSSADGKAGKSSGDWRDPWRQSVRFSDDGRQMLCEQIGLSIVAALGGIVDEMKKAGIEPKIDPRNIAGIYVLAMDDLLPERARMTPRIGAVVATSVVIGQRYYHHKAITEALGKDPEHQEWLRKQKEREAAEQKQRADHDAEVKAAEAAASSSSAPKYPDPPPPPEAPAPPVNGVAMVRATRARAAAEGDTDVLY